MGFATVTPADALSTSSLACQTGQWRRNPMARKAQWRSMLLEGVHRIAIGITVVSGSPPRAFCESANSRRGSAGPENAPATRPPVRVLAQDASDTKRPTLRLPQLLARLGVDRSNELGNPRSHLLGCAPIPARQRAKREGLFMNELPWNGLLSVLLRPVLGRPVVPSPGDGEVAEKRMHRGRTRPILDPRDKSLLTALSGLLRVCQGTSIKDPC